eukprot:m51a1_g4284 putative capsular polysaccharide phosphotransferase (335) ;mRNA; f:370754-376561
MHEYQFSCTSQNCRQGFCISHDVRPDDSGTALMVAGQSAVLLAANGRTSGALIEEMARQRKLDVLYDANAWVVLAQCKASSPRAQAWLLARFDGVPSLTGEIFDMVHPTDRFRITLDELRHYAKLTDDIEVSHGIIGQLVADATAESRTRDMGTLRYSLRSLEQNAPWVRGVFLVTDGQVPEWLNASSVSVVPHAAIFPGDLSGGLPTENSNAIEANLHRIPGLSQCFLYLNDDVFLWKPLERSFFVTDESRPVFHQGGQKAPSFPGYLWPSWHRQLYFTNEVLSTRYGAGSRNYPSHSCYLWSRDGSARTPKALEQLIEVASTAFPHKSRFEI